MKTIKISDKHKPNNPKLTADDFKKFYDNIPSVRKAIKNPNVFYSPNFAEAIKIVNKCVAIGTCDGQSRILSSIYQEFRSLAN